MKVKKLEALKGYSSDQTHFSEINVKLAAEKNKYTTHSVQRSLEITNPVTIKFRNVRK